ncbi:ABC transporter substrate-binding protein, partial [Candidatus Dependentiae bacterium]
MKKIYYFFTSLTIFLLCCQISQLYASFENLQEIQKYTQLQKEHPTIDNDNYMYPDFTTFFKKESPNWISRLLRFLKIKKSIWPVEGFKKLLENITTSRNKLKPQSIIKITPQKKSFFVIFGDLNGAFKSLYRDIKELKKLGFINEQLKIIKDNTCLIFNGNVLSRSAHIIETFTIILRLMKNNPNKVFFIKGEHEINENWKNHGFKEELKAKAKQFSDELIPLNSLVNKFIETLPLAVYINYGKKHFIRISNFDRNYEKLNEHYFYNVLSKKSQQILERFNIENQQFSNETFDVEIKTIIKGKNRTFSYEKTDGLSHLYPDQGAIAWSIFSSPTLCNQKLYNFYNDAFTILDVEPNKDPLITLYKQDAIKKKGFTTKTYNLLTEEVIKKKETKATEKEKITIATTLDLTGNVKEIGKALYQGISTRIKQENIQGGINGKKIVFIAKDDQFNPEKYLENLKLFLHKYKTNITLVNVGSTNLKKSLNFINKEKIGVFFPYTGSPSFLKSNLKTIVNLKTSYSTEANALIRYL